LFREVSKVIVGYGEYAVYTVDVMVWVGSS